MTLPRVLEPESMDSRAEAAEYEAMNHAEVNRQFVDDLLARGAVGRQVMDLGCGPAAIPIELCRRDESIIVLAIDSSIEMLEIAKREIDIAGLLDRVFLQDADAKSMDEFEDGMADTVLSNSLLHHLAEPHQGLTTAKRLLRENGRLFIRDLARPSTGDEVEQLVKTYAGSENEFAQQLFRQSLHAALTINEIRKIAGGLGIAANHVQMTSDRHWTLDWRG